MRPDEKKTNVRLKEEDIFEKDSETPTTRDLTENESKIIELEKENNNLKNEIEKLKSESTQKDEQIINLQSRLNLYVSKYNKDEITIDALQDKLLALLSSIK